MASEGIRYLTRPLVLMFLFIFSALTSAGEIIKSPSDQRDYLAFELENGLKALVISDPDTDQAGASLDVSVGSGDDPEGRQGLAHFLEHMLFLGTARYPKAGEYQTYISDHGGSHNAFTANDRTNYFFNVDSAFLEPTLDRFARFFIDPLFSPEYVQREKHAVHSEYQSKLKEDSRRGFSAFKQALNPQHRMAGFAVGSLDTLADRPDSDIRDELIRFYQQYYSADNMSLVVLGRQSTDELRAMVESRFSEVEKRPLPTPKDAVPLFKEGSLPVLMKVASIQETWELSMTFPVPPIRGHFEKKPLHYISALLGHEGPGSLLDILKQRGLARSLSAGPGLSDDNGATFVVNIGTTPEGYRRYQEIVDLSFQYLRLIRKSGVQARIFEEEQLTSETAFRFREVSNRAYSLTRIAYNMKHYPAEEVLRGDYLYRSWDPQLVNDYLDYLRPDNMLVTLTARDTETDRVDPWFSTPYSLARPDASQLAHWGSGDIDPELLIPEPNPFLASDFSSRPPQASTIPAVIKEGPGFRLWFKQEQEFRTPKADFYFTFRSPIANNSARHHVLTGLFVRLVNDRLNTFTYPAGIAGFSTSLYPHLRGFSLRLSGYRDKQPLLLERIVETLKNLQVDPERLAIFRTELRRQLENTRRKKPYSQGLEEIYQTVLVPKWSPEQQLQELDSITAEELQAFAGQLLSRGDIEALAHGDLLPEDALQLAASLESILLPDVTPTEVASGRVNLLPSRVEVRDLSIEHNDSAISAYIQAADKSLSSRARFALLAKIISPSFYNELRTEKQLGYIVFASPMSILEHPGLALVIQSPSATPDQLQQHVAAFIDTSLQLVTSVTEAQLESYKQSLLVELMEKDQKLSDRSNRYWQEIDRGYQQFDSREQLAGAIEQVTLSELTETYRSLGERQLIVRSAGQALSGGLTPVAAPDPS